MSSPENNNKLSIQLNTEKNSIELDESIMTFGPKGPHRERWQKAWDLPWKWSKFHGYEETFKLLIDVFNLQGEEVTKLLFRNIIEVLSHPYSISLLKSWAINDKQCSRLYKLARAARNDLDSNKNSISSIGIVSSGQVSKLSRDKYYLLQVFIKDITHDEVKYNEWMFTIRIWLLVHAMYRAERVGCFDNNLQSISSYLRLLLNNKKYDWDDFLRLQPPLEKECNFVGMNYQLLHNIASLRAEVKGRRLSRFLPAFEQVALGEDDVYWPGVEYQENPLCAIRDIKEYFIPNKDDKHWLPVIPHYSSSESEEDFVEAEVDPEDSYVYQKLSAESRLITQQEHLHYLPWSWDRLTPYEISELEKWIEIKLVSEDESDVLLATMVWIAIHIGRTLVRVLDIVVSEKVGAEWTLNPSTLSLQRQAPKRENSWEPKTDEQKSWIYPIANLNEVNLPNESIKYIKKFTSNNIPHSVLAEYWHQESTLEIEVVFNKAMQGDMNRIKSGMLANVLTQRTFDKSNNTNLPQMIAFHPQLTLAGAFAYGSWPCSHIKDISNNTHKCIDAHMERYSGKVIAFGSRVNPKEKLLKRAIQQATSKLKAINIDEEPIEFHNAYVSYHTVSLWAGTGVRPVGDSFESPRHFNFDDGFVFVNDKACDQRHMGRLVPLPSDITTILQTSYQTHLTLLAEALIDVNIELSTEINLLVKGQPSGNIPYFFHIDKKNLTWVNIYPENIDGLSLFEWPLRINLFRQRLAKVLPESGVEQEIVNAWLGHKNTKIECYGDYSIRSWLDDLKKNKNKINAAYESLGFIDVETWKKTPCISFKTDVSFDKRLFGIKLRADKREKKHRNIIQDTRKEIELLLNGKYVSLLEQFELDEIERRITHDINGSTHKNVLLRVGVLNEIIDNAWDEGAKKFSVSKRFVVLQEEFTNVKASSPYLYITYKKLKDIFNSGFSYEDGVSIKNSKLLCVFALMFENRISYSRMLEDIYNQTNFKLVKYKGKYYLEYSENLDVKDVLFPVQRHLVSYKTAFLLNNLLRSKLKSGFRHELCENMYGAFKECISQNSNKSDIEIIKLFCDCIDNANKIEFPGVVGAFLSGRVPSCSLNWYDWVRLEQGKVLYVSEPQKIIKDEDIVSKILKSETIKSKSRTVENIPNEVLLINAKLYVNEIRHCLQGYSAKQINKTISKIQKINSLYKLKVSSAILFVGYWIKYVIKRGKGKANKPYKEKSIVGYFSSLIHTFLELAYDKELVGIMSEELTDLYNDFLLYTKDLKGTYHADRLISFHKYCNKYEGVCEPDWEELDLPEKTRTTSPGFISEIDYFRILDVILCDKGEMHEFRLHMAFLHFLCFRFGLRAMEAIGLKRCDWVNKDRFTYVFVNDNSIRKLKTKGSRRIVPLLFTLSDSENKLVKEVIGQYKSFHHDDNTKGLFSLPNMKVNKDIEYIRRSLIELLKTMTGNPKMVIHHLRHSFSNNTSIPLYDLKLPLWDNIFKGDLNANVVRTTALGVNNSTSLRNSICAARLLGHAHPRTDAVSYQHFYGDWADKLVNICDGTKEVSLSEAIDIEKKYTLSSPVSTKAAKINIPNYNESTLSNLAKVMSLVANGVSFYDSGALIGIEPTHVEILEKIVRSIDKKMIVKLTKSAVKRGDCELLERITRSSWQRLIAFLKKYETCGFIINANLAIHPDNLVHMVGNTRQLTMWEDIQFEFVDEFLTYFNISDDFYDVASYLKDNPVVKIAEKYNISPDSEGTRADLDTAYIESVAQNSIKGRLNIIFKVNKDIEIRNSYQLIVCLISYYVVRYLSQR